MKSNFERIFEIPYYFQVYVHERVLISDSDGFAECAGEVPAEGKKRILYIRIYEILNFQI